MRWPTALWIFGVIAIAALALPSTSLAQTAQPSSHQEQLSESLVVVDQKHYIRRGKVEIHDTDNKTDIYADMVEFFEDENRAVATGNFVLSQGTNRISAERAEFNTKTMLGTFYNATGMATVQPPRQQNRPGALAMPTRTGEETVVYFFGETVEKVGPKKYKITKGGFSTCVQPTPRWEMSASTLILNVDHYTMLKNAVMTVKGVPMLYLPVLYYPTKREGRATGFLIPTYGSSSIRGQTIQNAFFWAIDRSQDATFEHDWYSKTGQSVGGEYRYNFGTGDGNLTSVFINQHEADYVQPDGTTQKSLAGENFQIRGGANQMLPGHLRARGNVEYFSDLATSQSFNTNIYDANRNTRSFGGNIVGAWNRYSLNVTLDHRENFQTQTDSVVAGSWPRLTLSRNEAPIAGTPLYFSVSTDYVGELNRRRIQNSAGTIDETDVGLGRFDVSPQVRLPFKKWQWFTVNTTVGWRDTYYTRSYAPTGDPAVRPSVIVDDPINRPVFTVQSQILGPVFNRIWDTPGSGYAEKFKHSIEPSLTIVKTANVDNFDRIVQFDGIDSYVGSTTYAYGLANRFYAKRKLAPGQPAVAREILSVEITQKYYTNQVASLYDRQFQTTAQGDTRPEHFSPIMLTVRAVPGNQINATLSAEFDSRYHELRTISASGTYAAGQQFQATVGWSKRAFIAERSDFNDPNRLDHSINASTTARTRDNRYGATYSFNYDVLNAALLQQQITGFYNAQCCGLAFQYQTYNNPFLIVPADHRFFLSFTLAGIGNFSPFNGAMSGVPR